MCTRRDSRRIDPDTGYLFNVMQQAASYNPCRDDPGLSLTFTATTTAQLCERR
jgi:hypothetical protein